MVENHQRWWLWHAALLLGPKLFQRLTCRLVWRRVCIGRAEMKPIFSICYVSAGLLAMTGLAIAQDQAPHPWRSVNDPPPAGSEPAPDQYPAPPSVDQRNSQETENYGIPSRLTVRPGTYLTVRVNQWLSSDRNQQGDAFTATLQQPLI